MVLVHRVPSTAIVDDCGCVMNVLLRRHNSEEQRRRSRVQGWSIPRQLDPLMFTRSGVMSRLLFNFHFRWGRRIEGRTELQLGEVGSTESTQCWQAQRHAQFQRLSTSTEEVNIEVKDTRIQGGSGDEGVLVSNKDPG